MSMNEKEKNGVGDSEPKAEDLKAKRKLQMQNSCLMMANYMLEGLRKLERVCGKCNNRLLVASNGSNFCPACDKKVLNAKVVKKETKPVAPISDGEDSTTSSSFKRSLTPLSSCSSKGNSTTSKRSYRAVHLVASYMRVKSKMDALSKQLEDCKKLDETTQLCLVIKACAETAATIKQLL